MKAVPRRSAACSRFVLRKVLDETECSMCSTFFRTHAYMHPEPTGFRIRWRINLEHLEHVEQSLFSIIYSVLCLLGRWSRCRTGVSINGAPDVSRKMDYAVPAWSRLAIPPLGS